MSDHRSLDERAPVTKPEPAPLRRANRRPDFQPCGGRPQVRCKSPDRVSHLEKMYRYHEDILKELSSRIETELFDRLEKRSMDKIQTEKANSAIAIYSDFLQYLRVSNARHLTAFPVNDTALEFYLDHLFCKGRKKRPLTATSPHSSNGTDGWSSMTFVRRIA